jgi:hypothetical protein
MEPIKVFFLEPTEEFTRALRRYSNDWSKTGKVCGNNSYHNALVAIEPGTGDYSSNDSHPHDDPRWPKKCECGYEFTEKDEWQLFCRKLYRRLDNGEKTTLHDAPEGAMWFATWMTEGRDQSETDRTYRGEDGECLVVKVPKDHEWMVDARCSNCTRLDDKAHKCWCRHGDPKTGMVHVDKNGNTCAAGAGSIVTKEWHGFLTNGYLITC